MDGMAVLDSSPDAHSVDQVAPVSSAGPAGHHLRPDGHPDASPVTWPGPAVPRLPRRPRQQTVRNAISCSGTGLHSGRKINLTLAPAPAGSGVRFRRTDLGTEIPARFDQVVDTRLSTVVGCGTQARVATIEHLMAALYACGIDNLLVEIDGPEVPVLDGSAAPFVFLIDCAGREEQAAPRPVIEVLRTVRVQDGEAFAELRPTGRAGLDLAMSIDFPARAIGRQSLRLSLDEPRFRSELASCRTFTMLGEIEALHRAGLARGGSLDNAVVVDDDKVLNPAGLLCPDEFVRHKMLDAVGDLSLSGAAIDGLFVGHRSGHGLNNRLLRALMADTASWRMAQLSRPATRESLAA